MDKNFSLKGECRWVSVNKIKQEIYNETGRRFIHRGWARSADGYQTDTIIEPEAFELVCVKLWEARAELERERAKKWWNFWK